jgi:hypothetical protein
MTRFRGMRWVAGGAVAVVVAVFAVAAGAASAGGRAGHRSASPGCYPPGSVTIAQDKTGRFYFWRRAWYVCVFKQGTPRKRFTETGAGFTPVERNAKVSGRYVALFAVCRGCRGPFDNWVTVIDMVTGHRTLFFHLDISYGDLVLKPDGSVAWTGRAGRTRWEVNRHDSTGTAIVDFGPNIDPYSLAAGGSWLYWTDAGSPRSTPFH